MGRRRFGSWLVIALFSISGVIHLVSAENFLWLMPPELGTVVNLTLVYVSGAVELICAVGLFLRLRWAPLLTTLTLLAIWPANLWFAFDQLGSDNTVLTVIAWIRVPLQLPLLWWAWKSPTGHTPRASPQSLP